jgi:pimeloyl-ACP methyl ester carboxylesterase
LTPVPLLQAVFANKADSPANIKAFEGLRNIVCPVLVLAGEDSGFAVLGPDPHTRLEQVLVVEMQSSRHSTFTLVPGVGHMLVVEAPERTARAVAEWLMSPTATTSNSSKI